MSSGKPLPDLFVIIHRYAFSGDAQKDLEMNLRVRQQSPQRKGLYKGAMLYRSHSSAGRVICEDGPYITESSAGSEGTSPLVMKVLDVVLAELNSPSPSPSNP